MGREIFFLPYGGSTVENLGPTLKNYSFPITHITKKKPPERPVKLFLTLFKLNISFFFK